MRLKLIATALLGSAACATALSPAGAAENGTSFYLLGSRANGLAGVTPPEGIFFQNDSYIYSGEVSKAPFDKGVVANVDAKAFINLSTILWVTPAQVLGGNVAFTASVPIGWQDVTGSLGPLSVNDSITAVGDPILGSFIGWHSGNFHWQTGVVVNVPVGQYNENSIANISFHRWAADVYGALTYLDPATGLDISNTIGFTFNGENPATDYRTGTEFHWEGAVTQNFSKQFSAGLAGYYYDQITGDSGSGALLGSFEGRAAGIGGVISYTFLVGGKIPITTRAKYFHEFDVQNRLQGDAGLLTVSMPLWVAQK